ncbi:hypothetical protein INT45_013466, partial [Circinella minor]
YAFVEFEDPRDADDAFNEMHGRRIDGYTISVQWARNAPSASWRFDRGSSPGRRPRSPSPHRYGGRYGGGRPPMPPRGRSRSRSPYYGRGGRSPSPRGRSPPSYERRYDSRSRSPPPPLPRYPDDRYPFQPTTTAATTTTSRSRSPKPDSRLSRSLSPPLHPDSRQQSRSPPPAPPTITATTTE